ADVARRSLPPNVLLTGGQCQYVAALTFCVQRLATNAPWELLQVLSVIAAGKQAHPRSPVDRRTRQWLPLASSDVDVVVAGSASQRESVRIGGAGHDEYSSLVSGSTQWREVRNSAKEAGVTHDAGSRVGTHRLHHGGQVVGPFGIDVYHLHDGSTGGAAVDIGADDIDILGVYAPTHQDPLSF